MLCDTHFGGDKLKLFGNIFADLMKRAMATIADFICFIDIVHNTCARQIFRQGSPLWFFTGIVNTLLLVLINLYNDLFSFIKQLTLTRIVFATGTKAFLLGEAKLFF